ncbi:MAG TPA: NUDIX domain-containing protein [Chthoniobacterales bacterium]
MKSTSERVSAGILMYHKSEQGLEVLLVHPGGPFFVHKDEGFWSIPKGEAASGEDLLSRAQIEFEEEVGTPASGPWIPIGTIRQKGGKLVHGWACQGSLPELFQHRSNTFEMEWPPHSGKRQSFPEVDQARFFSLEAARRKIKPTQVPFLDRLMELA